MNSKQLLKFRELKTHLKINLKNHRFFSGYVKSIESNSLVFVDKFGNEIIIDFDSIAYIVPIKGEVSNGKS